jgi:pimeloyl-ACP methyl ester carboxylesterase
MVETLMHAVITRPLDWASIQLARLSVRSVTDSPTVLAEAEALLEHPGFLPARAPQAARLEFTGPRDFRYPSPIPGAVTSNKTVYGKLFTAGTGWRRRPTVILLHGWNAETGYRVLFPMLARQLNRRGINAAMLELPYHGRRKPGRGAPVTNFLSDDLVTVVEATRQSVADTRALAGWLAAEGCPRVGLWGISLGAWLAGLTACADQQIAFAVLKTPVARIDRVIGELDFCRPIRRRLAECSRQRPAGPARIERLNLREHRPRPSRENILLVASRHDLFAPLETVEELWQAWGQPELWRIAHGHISVLMSPRVVNRTLDWITARAQVN